jgi:hypothetical protein
LTSATGFALTFCFMGLGRSMSFGFSVGAWPPACSVVVGLAAAGL